MKLLLVILMLFINVVAFAVDRYPFVVARQRHQFMTLTRQFRCLVCQNEDLASSNAPLAADLRAQIYQMVKKGKTNQQIRDYMVHRYGNFVLLKPPLRKSTGLLWAAPFLLLLGGFFVLWKVVRKYRD